MRVSLHPSDNTGCGLYRMRLPAAAAAATGVDVQIVDRRAPIDFHPYQAGAGMVRYDSVLGMLPRDPTVDVVVLQRVASRHIAGLIEPLQKLGQAVVVDVDDDMACIQRTHPAFTQLHPDLNPDMNWAHTLRACELADLVIVPSRALARRYAPHGRVVVLPNCVPERLLAMPRSSDGQTVGWAGWAAVHPGDLAVTRGGVAEALRATGARMLVVGPGEGVRQELRLDMEPDATGGLELEDYYAALGRLDVGIAPLADIRFNSGKGHKGLEMAARGVPFVASPTAHYPALAEQGVGVLAADWTRDWSTQLTRLLTDRALRDELAAHGREVIASQHTYERNGWRWAEAWEQARANHLARRRAPVAA